MGISEKQLEILYKYNKKRSRAVYQFDYKTGKFVAEHISMREAERATGIKNNNICCACTGKKKQAGGFIWLYKEI